MNLGKTTMTEMELAKLTVDYAMPIMRQVRKGFAEDRRVLTVTARDEALIEALVLAMVSAMLTLEASKAGVLPDSLKAPRGQP